MVDGFGTKLPAKREKEMKIGQFRKETVSSIDKVEA
jgi:hypothetical protein